MTTFNDREREAERRFEHKEELRFKASARRNKMLGLWLAEQMGIEGAAAEAYAKEVVISDFKKPGDDDVVEKVMADIKTKGLNLTEHKIRLQMSRLYEEAHKQIVSE